MWKPALSMPSGALLLSSVLILVSCGGEPSAPRIGPPATLSIESGDSQRGPAGEALPQPLVVRVLDARGGRVGNVRVNWSAQDGAVDSATTTADANGVARNTWRLGTAVGIQRLQAATVGTAAVAFTATAVAAAPARVRKVAGDNQTGTVGTSLTTALALLVLDRYGNPATGASVSWSARDGSVAASSVQTDTTGIATNTWTLGGRAGTQTVVASVPGTPGDSATTLTFGATAQAGPVDTVLITRALPASVDPGATIDSVTARVTDRFGNGKGSVAVSWTVTGGGGRVSSLSTTTDSTGATRVAWTVGAAPATPQTLAVRAEGGRRPATTIAVSTTDYTPPLRFAADADWVSPNRTATVHVLDVHGWDVPSRSLVFLVESYGAAGPPRGVLSIDSSGVLRGFALDADSSWSYRIRATFRTQPVTGLMLVVARSSDADRVVFSSKHWQIIAPRNWIAAATRTIPDFDRAMDVGWQAQHDALGMTMQEARNVAYPTDPIGNFASAIEDGRFCGVSSEPIRFGHDCFLWPFGPNLDQPRWFIIFHEMGHHGVTEQPRFISCEIFCRGVTYNEGEASLLSLFSSHRIIDDKP